MSAPVTTLMASEVHETIDGDRAARFERSLLTVPGPAPLGIVRKRLAGHRDMDRVPLLLVHGFGQNRHAWHLSRRSLANHLAHAGHDVFKLDLRGHGRSRRMGSRPAARVEEYLHEDLPRALDAIRATSGHERVVIVGHSMGGLLGYALAGELPQRVHAVAALAAPYDWARGAPVLEALAHAAALVGRVGFRTTAFPMAAVRALFDATQPLWDSRLVPLPVRAWRPRSFEPAVLEEFLASAFDGATFGELASLTSYRAGRPEHLARAFESRDIPLLVVAGTHDPLALPAAARAAYDRSASRDRTFVTFPAGHADLLLGRHAPSQLWPTLTRWLASRTRC